MNTIDDTEFMHGSLIVRAIDCVNEKSQGTPLTSACSITINFHPDVMHEDTSVLSMLLHDGIYHSQFETAIGSGSLSAHAGGRRWNWESAMFCGVYDSANPELRPKYGALNYKKLKAGAAPRFGSAHLRLKPHVLSRATFAYPDSHLDPVDFGTQNRMRLIAFADANKAGLDILDDYIEAHVHGILHIERDVDALVLDPSFRNTPIESVARKLPCAIEWHDGFKLTTSRYADWLAYRGKAVADFLEHLCNNGDILPATLSQYRDHSVDAQIIKKAWHCLARFG